MFGMDADRLFPKRTGGLYMVNQEVDSCKPLPPWDLYSHTFIAATTVEPRSGREVVQKTYSWASNPNGMGMYEDPYKHEYMICAQKALDLGMVKRLGGEDAVKAAERHYQSVKDYKEWFMIMGSPYYDCKTAAGHFWGETQRWMKVKSPDTAKATYAASGHCRGCHARVKHCHTAFGHLRNRSARHSTKGGTARRK
jgi:hypothetical protein